MTQPAALTPQSSPPAPFALEALVVLGCRVRDDGRGGAALLRRVDCAASLYRAGATDHIVMSGGRRWKGVSEADAMQARWLELGLNPEALLLERRSLTTRGNAHCSAELLRSRGLRSVGLVTCDYHLPRALGHFAAQGLWVRGYPVTVDRTLKERLRLWGRELGARLLDFSVVGRSIHWMDPPTEAHFAEATPSAPPHSTAPARSVPQRRSAP